MTTNNSNAEKWHLYHGTSLTRLASIVELGLLSSHILMDRKWPIMWGCSPGTCMTPNYALAWQYARIEEGVSGAVVLKIEVDRKDLLEDPDPSHMPGQSFYVTQPIPPRAHRWRIDQPRHVRAAIGRVAIAQATRQSGAESLQRRKRFSAQ